MRLHKKLWKDSFREIWKTKQQFLAIFAIIALGSGFYSGIKLASPDMLLTAKNYYEDTQLSDFNLLCTYGITQEDVEDLEQQSFVSQVQPSYYCDVFSNNESSEDGSESVVRLYSYSPSDTLNQLTVVAGRLPESANECVVDSGSLGTSNEDALNTTVSFSLEDSQLSDQLTNTSYTVVGVVESPLYVNFQRGSTTIGNGTLSAFYYIPEENFQSDYYTNCYVRIDGAAGLDPYGDEYDALIDEATEKLEQWGEERAAVRLPQVQAEAMDAYNESKAQFDQASAEAQAQLQDAWNQLEAGRLELESGRAALEQANQQYEEGIQQGEQRLNEAKTQLEQAQIELSVQKAVAQANVASSTTQMTMIQSEVDQLISEFQQRLTELDQQCQESIDQLTQQGLPTEEVQATFDAQKQAVQDLIDTLQNRVTTTISGIQSSAADQLAQSMELINQAQQQITNGWGDYYDGVALLEQQRESGQQQLDDAQAQLDQGQAEYDQGLAQYNDAAAQAQTQLESGQQQLDDALAQINELEAPDWYVQDRSSYNGYADFEEDALRVDKISDVFAVFFILVAILVCLTTMTRLVEEHRTEIGTYQALGYRRLDGMKKYLIYAALASFTGSVLGVLFCEWVFPLVIFNAYGMMYIFPDVITPVHWNYLLGCAAVSIGCTCLTASLACYGQMRGYPAALMRPKAPKAGKRILLERIKPIWNHLSFSWKVTMRNFFRYKKRVLMTIVGIAGCTALLMAGFGIRYSITSILDLQFGELFVYDAVSVTTSDLDESAQDQLEEEVLAIDGVNSAMYFSSRTVDSVGENTLVSTTVVTPQRTGAMRQYIVLRDKDTKETIPLTSNGAVINEKLAELLNVQAGDTIQIDPGDGSTLEVKVSALTENYAGNYIYLSEEYYRQVFGEDPSYTNLYLTFDEEADGQAISQALMDTGDILGLSLVSDLEQSFQEMLTSLNYVVIIIIISAGALAFVVLYNLANINIAERKRELATIKVLGFYDFQVSAYVYRENIVCTLCGIAAGLALGVALTQYVLASVEVDVVRFNRATDIWSFVFSGLLTALFALLVNVIMHYKLKKIDMVESLKSVE